MMQFPVVINLCVSILPPCVCSFKPSLLKASHSPAASPAEGSTKSKMQLHPTSWTQSEVITQPLDSPTATQSGELLWRNMHTFSSRVKIVAYSFSTGYAR